MCVPVYVPLMMQNVLDPSQDLITARGNNRMESVGRLRDGVTLTRAEEVMDAVLVRLREEYPAAYEDQLGSTLVPENEAGIHPSFGAAQLGMGTVMMVVVGLLLLIACVNVANLFLARARDRRREMAIRLSIGASRRRLIQQLLTESLLFSVIAGLAGLALSQVAMGALGGFRPPLDGPWDMRVEIDSTVLAFTALVSLAAGLVFGMAPALQGTRPDTAGELKGDLPGGSKRSRTSSTLVVAQMALSLLLLMSSGLFLRSLQGATEIDAGFDDPGTVVTLAVDPGLQGYDEPRSRDFWDQALEQTRALADVEAAALAWSLPLGLSTSDRGVEIPGHEFAEGERSSLAYTMVSDGYFETMGIDVVAGRVFTPQDDEGGAPVLVVNQRFAERFWPGESALGKVVTTAGADRTVIGVVETGRYRSLGEPPTEFMYLPYRDQFRSDMTIVARAPRDPSAAMRRIQEIVRGADADMPVYDVRSMEEHLGTAMLPARLGGSVLGIFGLLGLTLAAVGIYGVMAYSVSQRRRELGIRVAMGADRAEVLRLVLREGMKLALLGTAIGIVGALGAARLVQGLLYNVSALDPVTFGAVPLLLVAVAALAVYVPARRAASVDPVRALKSE